MTTSDVPHPQLNSPENKLSRETSRKSNMLPNSVIGIGASAGGLEALERFFQYMPHDTGMAFVVVQHLSPDFKSLMNELLARWTSMPVLLAEDRLPIEANNIYLMPAKKEMIISHGRLLLTDKSPSHELTLPIDQFFRSLARDAGASAVGIVLSGTGSDGSRGLQEIHQAGGLVLVQSCETAKFDGMPRSALDTGIVDGVFSPEEMSARLLKHIDDPRSKDYGDATKEEHNEYSPIILQLRNGYGIDFTHYKPSTVTRRTERRMQIVNAVSLDDYSKLLQEDARELDALYHDLLIGVTRFFRDEEAYAVLEHKVLPELIRQRPIEEEFRLWVAGCATGEEAYSLAILIRELLERAQRPCNAKVFATDVHRKSLEIASLGGYNEESLASMTPDRLQRFFTRKEGRYHVSSELRQMVVFAPHNIIKDAPFTKMDLISCRNLLIYLQPETQRKLMCLFHFGLRAKGILFLGPSESPGEIAEEFDTLDAHWKIYRKRREARLPADLRLPMFTGFSTRTVLSTTRSHSADRKMLETCERVIEQAVPPAILINSQREIVHIFGEGGHFLRKPKGKPSQDILEMLREDLKLPVSGAIHRCERERKRVVFTGIHSSVSDSSSTLRVAATPIKASSAEEGSLLITFENVDELAGTPAKESRETLNMVDASRERVDTLEGELRYTRESLQATIEELEASNEELQATNEEMLASNEELQSTNEELHSVNEELYTVNAEYQKKISELTELTNDINNLLVSTNVHTIFLDEHLCIRKFTPRMSEVFNLISADIGRRIDGFMHTIRSEKLLDKLKSVLEKGEQYEEEVQMQSGDEFLMRILPYRGGGSERTGVVLTLIDITLLNQAEARFRNALEAAPSGMLMIDRTGRIALVNSETERLFGYNRGELDGQDVEVLIPERFSEQHVKHRHHYFKHPGLRNMGSGLDLWGIRKDGQEFPVDVRLNPIHTPEGTMVLAAIMDVTERRLFESFLRDQVDQRDRFLATLSHELRNPMAAILSAASLLDRTTRKESEGSRACAVIRRQASQISRLLDDLLDVSRITQNKVKLRREATDLVKLIHEAIEAMQPMQQAYQHQMHTALGGHPVWVEVDTARILQVIENLLTNAYKYTPPGGEIRVSLTASESTADICVADNGRGIPAEIKDSIFDMFMQADDSLDRSAGGMGVGLTLVRSLVELHGGSIDVESNGPNQGSKFCVHLPLTPKRPTKIPPKVVPTCPADLRIVLVEDSEDARDMLASLLELDGYTVTSAANGMEGLEAILKHRPEVAIVDIGLPDLNGYELAQCLRQQATKDDVYLIALTGYGQEEDHERVMEAGFDEHLVKPVNMSELTAALGRMRPRDASTES